VSTFSLRKGPKGAWILYTGGCSFTSPHSSTDNDGYHNSEPPKKLVCHIEGQVCRRDFENDLIVDRMEGCTGATEPNMHENRFVEVLLNEGTLLKSSRGTLTGG
jgi:hypothetical protein